MAYAYRHGLDRAFSEMNRKSRRRHDRWVGEGSRRACIMRDQCAGAAESIRNEWRSPQGRSHVLDIMLGVVIPIAMVLRSLMRSR